MLSEYVLDGFLCFQNVQVFEMIAFEVLTVNYDYGMCLVLRINIWDVLN